MDSVMTWPSKVWKGFSFFINMINSFISPSSESITASESSYTNQILYSQEVNEKIGQAVKEGNLWNVICVVRNIIIQNKSRNPVRIAVTGDSGSGMSSFINALRFIGHEEEDSAPTGVVRTTQEPASYFSCEFPNVELWDLPGTGVTSQSMENYLHEMGFDNYDLIIIIASEQFSSNHVKLAKAMQSMRRKFYVVWTKLDRDLSSSPLSEPQLLQSIQKNIWENLQKEGMKEPPIFLVSNFEPSSHDFPKLRDTLKKDISNIRYTDSLETLSGICDKSIDYKAFSLKEAMQTEHLPMTVSRMCGTADLQESFKTHQESFGVDDGSLWQLAQRTGTLEMGYRAMQFQDLHKMSWRLKFLMCFPVGMFLNFLAHRCWFGLWNFVIRKCRHKRQRLIIEVVAQDTKTFLRRVLKENTFPTEVL
ncbi:immunity-related GTPase family M protein 1 [Cricetulus griseus]|uniref:Immunity-related GTPase family M protein 1 n=1 Tax=Cricetulus griseus TaxID=10029 RepID=A0A8C2M7P8_CRIGR|nr:immunity-related GTPase family M protein 1 [Cricetulus griseus]ERE68769.1 interferon-inducible GTPase 1-like protein [Cricetulus griseus]